MKAVVLGVSGLTGRAVAAELAVHGWQVVGTGRDAGRFPAALAERGVGFVRSDRTSRAELAAVLGPGADLVVDCVCYTGAQARDLVEHAPGIGSAVVLSSKAVYVDDHGRGSNTDEPPDFGGPVTETRATLPPDWSGDYDSREGYGGNKVAAEQVLLDSGWPVSVLRPSRIHGVGGARPREWFVVRRVLDGRTRVPLAHGGRTANHPTAAVNLARLVRTCAEHPGTRVLNAADPDTPTAAEVVTAVAAACGAALEPVGLPDEVPGGGNPWSTWPPYLLDTAAARALGWQPVGTYAEVVRLETDWLTGLEPVARDALDADPYFAGSFDYAAEDALLADLGRR